MSLTFSTTVVICGYFFRNAFTKLFLEGKTGDPTTCAGQIFALILALLKEKGLAPGSGELPQNFFRRVDEALSTDLESCTQILEKMEFGSHEISDEERGMLSAELNKILGVMKPFRGPGNTKIMHIICSCTKK